MNLDFFKKTKKDLSLKSFHEKPNSPEGDWLTIMLTCFIYVLVSAGIAIALFVISINTDTSSVGDTQDMSDKSIDINKLNKALEFINSRGK